MKMIYQLNKKLQQVVCPSWLTWEMPLTAYTLKTASTLICKVEAVNGIPQVGHKGQTTCCLFAVVIHTCNFQCMEGAVWKLPWTLDSVKNGQLRNVTRNLVRTTSLTFLLVLKFSGLGSPRIRLIVADGAVRSVNKSYCCRKKYLRFRKLAIKGGG